MAVFRVEFAVNGEMVRLAMFLNHQRNEIP